MNNLYKEDSIKSLDPREFTRLRAGVYCGSTEYSTQLVKEIFANALDEHNIGHGNIITISINTKENKYTVKDNGQGFPFNKIREDGKTILEAAFSVLNTSGKYDEDGVYGASALGLNGIGAKLATFLSKYLIVSSSTGDGKVETIYFKDGIFDKRELQEKADMIKGTEVIFVPDGQFFTNKEANLNELRQMFKEISALCPNLKIELIIDDKKEIYNSTNGLNDLVNEKVDSKEIIKTRFNTTLTKKDDKLDICLTYTSKYADEIIAYVNYGLTDSGVHITTIKTNITRIFNKYANENSLLKKGEKNLTGQELSEGMILVFNLKASGVQYDSQTKTRVTDIDKTLLNEVSKEIYQWLQDNPKDAKIIIEKALEARRAKEAAKKAREAIRKPKKQKGLKAKMQISDKLADCNSKNRKECELFVVEGDSAAGSAKSARTNSFQAIMPLRGKILNTEKITETKAMENKEISTLINVIGTGIKEYCDYKKSRYGKIILLTDADVDGSHIDILILTFLYKYMRPLIEQGMIYLAVPPLYRVRKGNKYKYLKDDEELDEYRKYNSNFEIQRFKGLM